MNRKTFIALILGLMNAGFKGEKPLFVKSGELTATGDIWFNSLRGFTPEILQAVIADVLEQEEFFPAIATLHKYARRYIEADETDGSEAWGKFMREAARVGGVYGTPEFPDDPCMLETIKLMGWRDICTCLEKDVPTLRAQMRDIYNSVKKRQKTKKRMEQLAIDPTGLKKLKGAIAEIPIKTIN